MLCFGNMHFAADSVAWNKGSITVSPPYMKIFFIHD